MAARAEGSASHEPEASSSHIQEPMVPHVPSDLPSAQLLANQQDGAMRSLEEERKKNDERFSALEMLVHQLIQHKIHDVSTSSNLPASIRQESTDQQTGHIPAISAAQMPYQSAFTTVTTPMPVFYPGMHVNLPGVTSTPLSTGQFWPPQLQPQSTGFYTGDNGSQGFHAMTQPFFPHYNAAPWVQPWAGQATTHAPHNTFSPMANLARASPPNTLQQIPQHPPTTPEALLAATAPTPSMTTPFRPAVEVPTQTPATDPRIDQLVEAMAAMQASLKKDNTVSEAIKRLRPLADAVYDEVLPAKYKRPNFTKFDGNGNPWDHITIFEIECGSIVTNEKLKLQQFPSSLTSSAMRWFNNRPHGSIGSWEILVEQFTAHFQSMEVPVKIEHLRLCTKASSETFRDYVQWFRTLASQMKETPDLKEIVRICAMNSGPAAWYLTSAPCSTFEELFEKVLTYEELTRANSAGKAPQFASVNAVADAYVANGYNGQGRDRRDKQKNEKKNQYTSSPRDETLPRKWPEPKDYSFDIEDTERWFDALLKKEKIIPLTPKEPVQPEDQRREDFCRFHQRVGHATVKCRTIMKIVQDLFDQGKLQYSKQDIHKGKAVASIMMAVHDPTSESQAVTSTTPAQMKDPTDTQEEHTLELVASADKASLVPPPPPLKETIYDVVKQMRRVPALISMFDALSMSPASRMALEFALAEIAEKNGGAESFFINNNGVKDYATDVEFLGHPLPVLTKVNPEQRSRTDHSWPQTDDRLTLPSGIVTFSNEDLCHPEPNHNRPLFVSIEHRNKIVRRALVDPGASLNLLPRRVLHEMGYGDEHLQPTTTNISSVSPTGCESNGKISLHISVGPFSMPHIFHVIDLDPVFHMLLGRPWIHDHRCVPSSWHQCIKAAPVKGNQVRIRGLQNPFALEEAHFIEAGFFMEGNVLQQARQRPAPHAYPALTDLPSFINPTANYPPKLPPRIVKIHNSGVATAPAFTNDPNGSLMPMTVTIHGGKTSTKVSSMVAHTEKQKTMIENEDLIAILGQREFPPCAVVDEVVSIQRREAIIELNPRQTHSFGESQQHLSSDEDIITIPRRQKNAMPGDFTCSTSFVGVAAHEGSTATELSPAPPHFEEGVTFAAEQLEEVHLGDFDGVPRPTFLGTGLNPRERRDLIDLLRQYIDCFAWSYDEMPGLSPEVALHRLAVKSHIRPVAQARRKFCPGVETLIAAEIEKLKAAKFIREVQYPQWIANIVPVKKKNGQLRVCVDFRDINKACPKDAFPLPLPDLLLDNVVGCQMFSFMDGYSGYNQIHMAPEDEEKTAFYTPVGIYCYTVMPFGLKNAGATYQRAMQHIFSDMLHKDMEDYVDDIIVKSEQRKDHCVTLERVLHRCRVYNLKLNPRKCAFGVTSGQFLGFLVHERGIRIDPAKLEAISCMSPPTSLRQLQSFLGKINYIRRFIPDLSAKILPLTQLMKKGEKFLWNENCNRAFEEVKKALLQPPTLLAPRAERPLLLYISHNEFAIAALLAQADDLGRERPVYYLSRVMNAAEQRYTRMEKACLALVFAAQKLRHYFLTHEVYLIVHDNPVRYLLQQPALSGRAARWLLKLMEFDIKCVTQKAMKGQALAELLASHPPIAPSPVQDVFSANDHTATTWTLYFDGSAVGLRGGAGTRGGAGVVLMEPSGRLHLHSYSLTFICTNNSAEYEALMLGLILARDLYVRRLLVKGDSLLIIQQVLGEYDVNEVHLQERKKEVTRLIQHFESVKFQHVARSSNRMADALALLGSKFVAANTESTPQIWFSRQDAPAGAIIPSCAPQEVFVLEDYSDWYRQIIDFLSEGRLPDDRHKAREVRRICTRYALHDGVLYRRGLDGVLLRCLTKDESLRAMHEAHQGSCGEHQGGRRLHQLLFRTGYHWPNMLKDCLTYAQSCPTCQRHAPLKHLPPEPLHPVDAYWPFQIWGLDFIGPIHPTSSKGHKFVLTAVEYFTKWAEAAPLRRQTGDCVAQFIKEHIICRFGIPQKLITDNGTPFLGWQTTELIEKYNIQKVESSPYNPQSNGQVESFNKILKQLLRKTVSENQRDWHEKLLDALWSYRTSIRLSTGVTPFSLVYGADAVLPLEIQVPAARLAIATALTPDSVEYAHHRISALERLDEQRREMNSKLHLHRDRMARQYNKHIALRKFIPGMLVLCNTREVRANLPIPKFAPSWEGPYVIHEDIGRGCYDLTTVDGDEVFRVNARYLKLWRDPVAGGHAQP